jgi:hypothetical protein
MARGKDLFHKGSGPTEKVADYGEPFSGSSSKFAWRESIKRVRDVEDFIILPLFGHSSLSQGWKIKLLRQQRTQHWAESDGKA